MFQHGTVQFDCTFSRPAVAAYLDWTPTSPGTLGPTVAGLAAAANQVPFSHACMYPASLPLRISDDHQSGAVLLNAVDSGKYRLVVAQRGVEIVVLRSRRDRQGGPTAGGEAARRRGRPKDRGFGRKPTQTSPPLRPRAVEVYRHG